jgi:hypothetical protein
MFNTFVDLMEERKTMVSYIDLCCERHRMGNRVRTPAEFSPL